MNDVILNRKIPSGDTGYFLVGTVSFMFLSQYRDTKAVFYLFYEITKVFSSFPDVIHASVI